MPRITTLKAGLAGLFLLSAPLPALAQTTLLQGGQWVPGHTPMYVGSGFGQPVVQDSGPASGGAPGVGLSELGITARGTGTAPFANAGTGPLGTNLCDYDGPTTAPGGYHYLCLSPNAQGGGLITYGAGGAASQLPVAFNVNGVSFGIPPAGFGSVTSITAGSPGIIVSPSTLTTTGTIALGPPGSSTLGGVRALSVITHNYLTGLGTNGIFTQNQPAFADLQGTATPGQLPLATSSSFGIVEPDNSTITILDGVITAVGGGGGGVSSVGTSSPLSGGPITSTGTIACTTCATTTDGGALSGTSPVAISSAGAISITGAAGQVLAGTPAAFTATPTLGASGTLGSLSFGNATTGLVKLQTVTGTLGTPTVLLPAASGTMAVSASGALSLNATTGALAVATATSGQLGVVEGDGSTLPITAGVIACATGTTSQLGCLKADGTTILVSGGVLSTNPASGGPVLLNTLTASNSASLIDTTSLTSTYKSYEIRLLNILPATDDVDLAILVSTNGGVSYDNTSNHYVISDNTVNIFGASTSLAPVTANNVNGMSSILLDITNLSGTGVSGALRIYAPSSASQKNFDYSYSGMSTVDGQSVTSTNGGGKYTQTSAVNAFKILMSSGNIASGIVEIWGYP